MRRTIIALVAALFAFTNAALATPMPTDVFFALQGGHAKTIAEFRALPLGNDPLARRIEISLTRPGSTSPIRSYDIDMTKYMHMVIVSDDFQTFLHVHPTLQPDGLFTIDQRFPRATSYHVYADVSPHAIGQQVFRFDLSLGTSATAEPESVSGTTVAAGPYVVTISTDSFKARVPTSLIIHISENGVKATGLHPYLGALAHAVFLNASTLTYMHVHPMPLSAKYEGAGMNMMDMPPLDPNSTSPPDMRLYVTFATAGTYRFWLQFRGADRIYVAPFVLTVS